MAKEVVKRFEGTTVRLSQHAGSSRIHVEVGTVDGRFRHWGSYYANEYGHFADPDQSQIQTIPCDGWEAALRVVIRLGQPTGTAVA